MLGVVWGAAATGIAIKLVFPGRFDRLAVVFYLAIGWSGVAILRPVVDTLPATTLWLIAAGGIVYSAGVVLLRLAPAALPERGLACFRGDRRRPASCGGNGLSSHQPALTFACCLQY